MPASASKTRPYHWPGAKARRSAIAVVAADPLADAVDEAFRKLVTAAEANLRWGGGGGSRPTNPTTRVELRVTLDDLAGHHLSPLRNLILEIRWGQARTAWIELVQPVLRSLRGIAGELQLPELIAAIDGFSVALDRARSAGGKRVRGEIKAALIEAYGALVRCSPKTFCVDQERDRREGLIVDSLLQQAPELDPLLLGRLSALGLTRLENLLEVTADKIVSRAGVSGALASVVVQRLEEFRCGPPAIVAADLDLTKRTLEPLLARLHLQHDRFERAATGWTAVDVATKRDARRERHCAYLALRAALARLGEADLVLAVDKLPFPRRIGELERFVRQPSQRRSAVAEEGPSTRGEAPDGRIFS